MPPNLLLMPGATLPEVEGLPQRRRVRNAASVGKRHSTPRLPLRRRAERKQATMAMDIMGRFSNPSLIRVMEDLLGASRRPDP